MKFLAERKIRLEKPLDELDLLVLHFVKILEKHVDYVIVSGYVSILFGRSRGTEDIDVFIKPMEKNSFAMLYHELKKQGYWCLNAESDDEVYSYLHDGIAIRFAREGEAIPNFEVKFAQRFLDLEVFTDFLEVETAGGTINVSSLERQIAFKKYFLGSDKDLEDARHIEETFKRHLNQEKIKIYQQLINKENGKA